LRRLETKEIPHTGEVEHPAYRPWPVDDGDLRVRTRCLADHQVNARGVDKGRGAKIDDERAEAALDEPLDLLG